jgi:hypothetical protein
VLVKRSLTLFDPTGSFLDVLEESLRAELELELELELEEVS